MKNINYLEIKEMQIWFLKLGDAAVTVLRVKYIILCALKNITNKSTNSTLETRTQNKKIMIEKRLLKFKVNIL